MLEISFQVVHPQPGVEQIVECGDTRTYYEFHIPGGSASGYL